MEGIIVAFLRALKEGQKRFVKVLLIIFALLLIFGGPTYLLYILNKLEVPRLLIILIGLATLTVGIILFVYLYKGEEKVEAST
jgi:cytochrome c oxidase subunit IV